MDIQLTSGQHKSIAELHWLGIPPFAVVTGPNGSGKSQLLEMIASSAGVHTPEFPNHRMGGDPPPTPTATLKCSEKLNGANTVFLRSSWQPSIASASLSQVQQMVASAWAERNLRPKLGATLPSSPQWSRLWSELELSIGKPREEVALQEFLEALPPNFVLLADHGSTPMAMPNSIPLLFVSYLARIDELARQGLGRRGAAEQLSPLPWDTVNDVLKSAGLQYRVLEPQLPARHWAQPWDIVCNMELENTSNGVRVPVQALSSGERVMFTVAVWSYYFRQSGAVNDAKLLLLDEPDAHLHPALTKAFLRVVRSELVEKHNMRVIMTTHSPSTVALTDEASLFVMSPSGNRLRHVASKWEAVAQLTAGLVTVGDSTKTVFVEDKHDADFFRVVQTCLMQPKGLSPLLDSLRSMNFIPASLGNAGGGANNVAKWVDAIPSSQIAGIVDRDDDNPGAERVHVLRRRNLESYLFDPLYVYALLLDDNLPTPEINGVCIDANQSRSLLDQPEPVLQKIVDGMLGTFLDLLAFSSLDDTTCECRYHNGKTVSLPLWFVKQDIKPMFDPLRKRFGVKWDHEHLIRRYQAIEIVPADLVDVLSRIQVA